MKGWFEILCTEQLDRAEKKVENKKFDVPALLGANISQIFAAVLFNWTLTFLHPSASVLELQLLLVKILGSFSEASHLVPNI